jgi:Family of unknown function (DUF5681)
MGKFVAGDGRNLGERFQPGVSGNPAGRQKALREVAAAAREHTVEAIATLARIMRDTKTTAAARVNAATVLLDRGWGKAPQTVDLRRSTELGDMSDAELIAIIAAGGADGTEPKSNGGTDPAVPPGNPSQPH